MLTYSLALQSEESKVDVPIYVKSERAICPMQLRVIKYQLSSAHRNSKMCFVTGNKKLVTDPSVKVKANLKSYILSKRVTIEKQIYFYCHHLNVC